MIKRRGFLAGTLSAMTVGSCKAQSATAIARDAATFPEPLVWPVVTKVQSGIRSFAGHTDTVPDIVGRIGTPPDLVIFTEGNHLMVLLGDEIVGAFPSWARRVLPPPHDGQIAAPASEVAKTRTPRACPGVCHAGCRAHS